MESLSHDDVALALLQRPHWSQHERQLVRTFEFPRFEDAIRFVTQVASIAIALDHHPDLHIRSGSVTIFSTTHDAGGLTRLDFELASRCDALAAGSD